MRADAEPEEPIHGDALENPGCEAIHLEAEARISQGHIRTLSAANNKRASSVCNCHDGANSTPKQNWMGNECEVVLCEGVVVKHPSVMHCDAGDGVVEKVCLQVV